VRVVVVSDRFGHQVGAALAAARLGQGWQRQAPHDHVEAWALSDGGPGFADAVAAAPGSRATPVVVHGPAGGEVPAQIVTRERDGVRTAYLDAAHAAGRHLVAESALLHPQTLSSAGVGELLLAARSAGADRIVLGVGDLATHDGGRGLLSALGAGEDLADLADVRVDWSDTRLVLAAATELPLTGFHGASAALGTEHGLAVELTQELERGMGAFVELVDRRLPPPKDLLTGLRRKPEREPGAGLGGGVGYAVQRLGARTEPGARLLLDELGVRERLAGALVVLGTDVYDWHTVHDGVVAETASAALDVAAPSVVLAREVMVGRREGMALGISGTYAVRDGEDLPGLAARVARTWSPAPTPPPAAPPPTEA
jgi:glycerate 2-kinase